MKQLQDEHQHMISSCSKIYHIFIETQLVGEKSRLLPSPTHWNEWKGWTMKGENHTGLHGTQKKHVFTTQQWKHRAAQRQVGRWRLREVTSLIAADDLMNWSENHFVEEQQAVKDDTGCVVLLKISRTEHSFHGFRVSLLLYLDRVKYSGSFSGCILQWELSSDGSTMKRVEKESLAF